MWKKNLPKAVKKTGRSNGGIRIQMFLTTGQLSRRDKETVAT